MRTVKKILILVAILVAIPFIVALFVDKDYAVERSIHIEKPVAEVFDYVKYLKNQNNYSKWSKIDGDMKKNYKGIDGEPGFVSYWESENPEVGKGEQKITKIIENERIEYELRFIEPFDSKDQAYMLTQSTAPQQTKVTWGFEGHMKYPMNLMLLFLDLENQLGNDLEQGLNDLKEILER